MATNETLVADARAILHALGLPKAQQNERAAIVLLALLDLRDGRSWAQATDPLRGISPIIDYANAHLGKTWAANTRETVRRGTIHQFVHAGVCRRNPDSPNRPVNSQDTVYQIGPELLPVLRQYGQKTWQAALEEYLPRAEGLAKKYRGERDVVRVKLDIDWIPAGITLTPGGQNPLVRAILADFATIFAKAPRLVYLGDTGQKDVVTDVAYLAELGVTLEGHGQIPDVVIHDRERDWLILVEAVTSHGPMNAKRLMELKAIFGGSRAGLVFVTAFLTRKTFRKYLADIAWETEVWIAEDPTHMIHFNGVRFLGPYEGEEAGTP